MKIMLILGTNADAVVQRASEISPAAILFPEAGVHASQHGDRLDQALEAAKADGAERVAVATHSKAVFTRLVRRVVEGTFSPVDVEIVWLDTERVMRFTLQGGIEGAKDHPPPRLFGEEEIAADLQAIQEGFILRANVGRKPYLVQQQRVDGRTGQPLADEPAKETT